MKTKKLAVFIVSGDARGEIDRNTPTIMAAARLMNWASIGEKQRIEVNETGGVAGGFTWR